MLARILRSAKWSAIVLAGVIPGLTFSQVVQQDEELIDYIFLMLTVAKPVSKAATQPGVKYPVIAVTPPGSPPSAPPDTSQSQWLTCYAVNDCY